MPEEQTSTQSLYERSRRATRGQAPACLVFIGGPHLGEILQLDDDPLLLGRDESCSQRLASAGVSRRHCAIRRRRGGYVIEDLDSTNGTWINDERRKTARLEDGDVVTIGDSVMKFIGERNLEFRYHAQLHQQVIRDDLTGLYNRRHFKTVLKSELVRAARYERSLALVVMDIDHFKRINDTFGHPAGDSLLEQLATTLGGRMRAGDNLFRIGGEEFALILPETSLPTAIEVAESYRERVAAAEFRIAGSEIRMTMSFGVAASSEGMGSPAELVAAADERTYHAKRSGRNRVEPRDAAAGS